VYVELGNVEAGIRAIDVGTGQLAWSHTRAGSVSLSVSAANGYALAVFDQRTVEALDLRTGEAKWEFTVATTFSGTPLSTPLHAVIVEKGRWEDVLQRDFRVTFLDRTTGRFAGALELPGTSFSPTGGLSARGDAFLIPTAQLGSVFLEFRVLGQ
jgi:outer membrane protein assembly factor BamB